MFKDILLHLDTYPDPLSEEQVRELVRFAGLVAEGVSAVAAEAKLSMGAHPLTDWLIDLHSIAAEQEAQSRVQAEKLLRCFELAAAERGVLGAGELIQCNPYQLPERIGQLARTRDLALFAYGPDIAASRTIAETAIFNSGRPGLIVNLASGPPLPAKLETVVVAWDASRSASRAVADAMPLLQKARKVRILSVLGEKPSVERGVSEPLRHHFDRHAIPVQTDEISAGNQTIGEVIRAHLQQHNASMLVMGAFGHSRLREFVLGGATESVMQDPPIPLFLSH